MMGSAKPGIAVAAALNALWFPWNFQGSARGRAVICRLKRADQGSGKLIGYFNGKSMFKHRGPWIARQVQEATNLCTA